MNYLYLYASETYSNVWSGVRMCVCVCVGVGGGDLYTRENKKFFKKSVRRFGNKTIDDVKRVVLTFAGCP